MKWLDKNIQLPISGIRIFAKKSESGIMETVPSDWVRHHLSQYQYWAFED